MVFLWRPSDFFLSVFLADMVPPHLGVVFLKRPVKSCLSLMLFLLFFSPLFVRVCACSKYYSKRVFKCVRPSHNVPTFTLSCTKKKNVKKSVALTRRTK